MLPADWLRDANERQRGKLRLEESGDRRAHYHAAFNRLFGPRDRPSTLLHELGHWLEEHAGEELPNGERTIHQALISFLRDRTEGESPQLLNDLKPGRGYDADELARPDKFGDPYVGRVYSGGRYSEVLTMALEAIYYGRHGIAERDPEHLHFVLGLLAFR